MNKIHNEKMKLEALERLELLKASPLSRAKLLNDWTLTKAVVNWEEYSIDDSEALTDEEREMVNTFEEKYEGAVYYVIQDEGFWPDGCSFPRYTFLYVSQYEDEWEFDKEDCIESCGTAPAYVINMEEPECSEITEILCGKFEGKLYNRS